MQDDIKTLVGSNQRFLFKNVSRKPYTSVKRFSSNFLAPCLDFRTFYLLVRLLKFWRGKKYIRIYSDKTTYYLIRCSTQPARAGFHVFYVFYFEAEFFTSVTTVLKKYMAKLAACLERMREDR